MNSCSYKIMTLRNILILMLLFFILLAIGDYYSAHLRTVVTVYHDAAVAWLQNKNLYDFSGGGYLYLPQAALLQIPFSYIHPAIVSNLIWRAAWMMLIAYTLFEVCKMLYPNNAKQTGHLYFFILLVTLAIGASAIRNGQLNMGILVMGFLSLIAIAKERWWLAASLLAIAVAMKTLTLVLFGTCFVLYPRLRLKLIVTSIIVFLLPFIGKNPQYVIAQYKDIFHYYVFLTHLNNHRPNHWAQIFGLLSDFGVNLSALFQTSMRVVFALLTLFYAFIIQKSALKTGSKMVLLYTVINSYLLLFGPITEGNTYIVFAPIVALFTYQLLFIERNRVLSAIMVILIALYLSSHGLNKAIIPGDYLGEWIPPLLTTIVIIWITVRFISPEKRKMLFNFDSDSIHAAH